VEKGKDVGFGLYAACLSLFAFRICAFKVADLLFIPEEEAEEEEEVAEVAEGARGVVSKLYRMK